MYGGDKEVKLLLSSFQFLLQLLLSLFQLSKLLPVDVIGWKWKLFSAAGNICLLLFSLSFSCAYSSLPFVIQHLPDCLKTCRRWITVRMGLNHLHSIMNRLHRDHLVLIESAIKKWIWILRSEKEECTQRPAGFEADVTSAPIQASNTWQLEASHSTFDQ